MRNHPEQFALKEKSMVIERQYGKYKVRICFAGQEDPDAPRNVMNAITQAFRTRVERARNEIGDC